MTCTWIILFFVVSCLGKKVYPAANQYNTKKSQEQHRECHWESKTDRFFFMLLEYQWISKETCGPKEVVFRLWTRLDNDHEQPTPAQLTHEQLTPEQFRESNFSLAFLNNRETKVIVHGWRQHGQDDFVRKMKNAYLRHGNYNIISIDWGNDASCHYPNAASVVTDVGNLTGELIHRLVENGANITEFHVIGFSLGAHVAGSIGKHVKQNIGNLGRITGLDPAYPFFREDNEKRLNQSDADFVDVIHTNSDRFSRGGLSFPYSIGHADFFPNGGKHQPPCPGSKVKGKKIPAWLSLLSLCWFNLCSGLKNVGCSHGRCPYLFIESITSSGLVARQCDSWKDFKNGKCNSKQKVVMGQNAPSSTRGNYYLYTNNHSKFALEDAGSRSPKGNISTSLGI